MSYFSNRSMVYFAALALAALSILACGGSTLPGGVNGPAPALTLGPVDTGATLTLAGSEEITLDPAKWLSGPDGIVGDIYSGLVRMGVTLRPIPELAESWDISPDGTLYTFHLREDVTFHDGRPFTAADVVYSWERAVDPDLGSNTAASYLDDIAGVRDVVDGKTKTISGLEIVDDHTLKVTIDAAKVYFLDKLTYPVSWIVDKDTIDQIETSPNGTGPFALVEHKENEYYLLARNDNYYLDPPAIQEIRYLIYADYPSRLYESDQIAIVSIGPDQLARAQDPADPLYGNVQAVTGFCTNYLSFDLAQKPFDDPLVRKAFVEAIDKDRYNDSILNGTGIIAQGLYPRGLPGYNLDLIPMPFSAENAARDLSGSGYGGPSGLPTITLTTFGSGGSISPADGLLIQMWKDVLGVDVQAQGLDYDSFYDAVYAGNHGQIINSGWCGDFPDPETFAGLFDSRSQQNKGHYHNPEVDALLEQARGEPDSAVRIRLYQQIEQQIVDDAAGLFLTHSQSYYVVTKPYLTGYVATPIGVTQNLRLAILSH